jgi:hypothetical protein
MAIFNSYAKALKFWGSRRPGADETGSVNDSDCSPKDHE